MILSQLKPCGVVTPRVVSAFFAVPREAFVMPERAGLAYVDAAQPLPNRRELMPALSLGRMVEEARIEPQESVLVVGAATGYAAAIVAELAGRVIALESDPTLAATARIQLSGRANVAVVEGALDAGHAEGAPYDLILIDGAVEDLPQPLVAQLAEGGRLLAILVGSDGVSRAAMARNRKGHVLLEPFAEASAAILPPFRKPHTFQF